MAPDARSSHDSACLLMLIQHSFLWFAHVLLHGSPWNVARRGVRTCLVCSCWRRKQPCRVARVLRWLYGRHCPPLCRRTNSCGAAGAEGAQAPPRTMSNVDLFFVFVTTTTLLFHTLLSTRAWGSPWDYHGRRRPSARPACGGGGPANEPRAPRTRGAPHYARRPPGARGRGHYARRPPCARPPGDTLFDLI